VIVLNHRKDEIDMTTETAVRPDAVSKLLAMSDIITPIAIRAAATHRVVSGLAAGQTVAEIAADRGLDVEVLDTLVRFLGEIGILDGDPTTPTPTEIGTILATAEDGLSLTGMLGFATKSLVALDHTLETGRVSALGLFGEDFWTALSRDRANLPTIEAELARGTAEYDEDVLINAVDWSGAAVVVEIGGGGGQLLNRILDAVPEAVGVLLDRGLVAEASARLNARGHNADRVSVVDQSYFDEIAPRGDVFVMSAVLADWADEQAIALLRRCREAAHRDGARFILSEVTLRAGSAREELYYRAMVTVPVRETAELLELGRRAGFVDGTVLAETPARSVIEFVAP